MLIRNVGFESVEWLAANQKLRSVSRSKELYVPAEVEKSLFTLTYKHWVDLTMDTGDFLGCPHIYSAPNGYDVEVDEITDDFPAEILERLHSFREIQDRDKEIING